MTEKWNGKSVYQLNQKKQRIVALDVAIRELTQAKAEAKKDYLDELGRIVGRDSFALKTGSWSCGNSPINLCVYDMTTAEQDDECLFCGEPNERK